MRHLVLPKGFYTTIYFAIAPNSKIQICPLNRAILHLFDIVHAHQYRVRLVADFVVQLLHSRESVTRICAHVCQSIVVCVSVLEWVRVAPPAAVAAAAAAISDSAAGRKASSSSTCSV